MCLKVFWWHRKLKEFISQHNFINSKLFLIKNMNHLNLSTIMKRIKLTKNLKIESIHWLPWIGKIF